MYRNPKLLLHVLEFNGTVQHDGSLRGAEMGCGLFEFLNNHFSSGAPFASNIISSSNEMDF